MDESMFLATKGKTLEEGQPDRLGYRVRYEDGYISWSPKRAFEGAYRLVTDQERMLLIPK